jgi:hypothetical protein
LTLLASQLDRRAFAGVGESERPSCCWPVSALDLTDALRSEFRATAFASTVEAVDVYGQEYAGLIAGRPLSGGVIDVLVGLMPG